ncbi:hypothetical protein SNEBB_008556 [Seison nebaliae]|nr:hypothetical protein SNEBB_008556 [Seison nebaliae]
MSTYRELFEDERRTRPLTSGDFSRTIRFWKSRDSSNAVAQNATPNYRTAPNVHKLDNRTSVVQRKFDGFQKRTQLFSARDSSEEEKELFRTVRQLKSVGKQIGDDPSDESCSEKLRCLMERWKERRRQRNQSIVAEAHIKSSCDTDDDQHEDDLDDPTSSENTNDLVKLDLVNFKFHQYNNNNNNNNNSVNNNNNKEIENSNEKDQLHENDSFYNDQNSHVDLEKNVDNDDEEDEEEMRDDDNYDLTYTDCVKVIARPGLYTNDSMNKNDNNENRPDDRRKHERRVRLNSHENQLNEKIEMIVRRMFEHEFSVKRRNCQRNDNRIQQEMLQLPGEAMILLERMKTCKEGHVERIVCQSDGFPSSYLYLYYQTSEQRQTNVIRNHFDISVMKEEKIIYRRSMETFRVICPFLKDDDIKRFTILTYNYAPTQYMPSRWDERKNGHLITLQYLNSEMKLIKCECIVKYRLSLLLNDRLPSASNDKRNQEKIQIIFAIDKSSRLTSLETIMTPNQYPEVLSDICRWIGLNNDIDPNHCSLTHLIPSLTILYSFRRRLSDFYITDWNCLKLSCLTFDLTDIQIQLDFLTNSKLIMKKSTQKSSNSSSILSVLYRRRMFNELKEEFLKFENFLRSNKIDKNNNKSRMERYSKSFRDSLILRNSCKERNESIDWKNDVHRLMNEEQTRLQNIRLLSTQFIEKRFNNHLIRNKTSDDLNWKTVFYRIYTVTWHNEMKDDIFFRIKSNNSSTCRRRSHSSDFFMESSNVRCFRSTTNHAQQKNSRLFKRYISAKLNRLSRKYYHSFEEQYWSSVFALSAINNWPKRVEVSNNFLSTSLAERKRHAMKYRKSITSVPFTKSLSRFSNMNDSFSSNISTTHQSNNDSKTKSKFKEKTSKSCERLLGDNNNNNKSNFLFDSNGIEQRPQSGLGRTEMFMKTNFYNTNGITDNGMISDNVHTRDELNNMLAYYEWYIQQNSTRRNQTVQNGEQFHMKKRKTNNLHQYRPNDPTNVRQKNNRMIPLNHHHNNQSILNRSTDSLRRINQMRQMPPQSASLSSIQMANKEKNDPSSNVVQVVLRKRNVLGKNNYTEIIRLSNNDSTHSKLNDGRRSTQHVNSTLTKPKRDSCKNVNQSDNISLLHRYKKRTQTNTNLNTNPSHSCDNINYSKAWMSNSRQQQQMRKAKK